MKLQSLRVQNFRNHSDFTCDFSPSNTLICGKNGAGKTSLLEAVYIMYRGSSFKGVDGDIVLAERAWYRVDIRDDTGINRAAIFDNREGKKQKQFTVDNKNSARLPNKYKYPIVLFTPDDLRLINGSPSRRRRYLDTVIAQYDPKYSPILRRYERALLQRNKLLKQHNTTADRLFSWNVILSETGAYIINARRGLTEKINDSINDYYHKIANIKEDINVVYTSPKLSPHSLLAHYESSFSHDQHTGSTSVGPQRHDLRLTMRTKLVSDGASRGEIRTIILALKYIEADLAYQYTEQRPVVLLDDVFGELDDERQKHLLTSFKDNQIIVTSTHTIPKKSLLKNATVIKL